MHQLAHAGAPLNRTADEREGSEKLDVIQYGVAKLFGGCREIGSGIGEDLLKIR